MDLSRPLFAMLLALSGFPAADAGPVTDAPPAETFFANYPNQQVSVSPSGRFIGLESSIDGGAINLRVIDLEGKEPPLILTQFHEFDVAESYWLSDEWLVFGVREARYANEIESWGQWFVHRSGKKIKRMNSPLSDQGLLAYLEDRKHVDPDDAMPHPPERLDFTLYDNQELRRAGSVSKDGRKRVYWLDRHTKLWKKIGDFPWLEEEFKLAFVNEKDELFVYAVNPRTSFSELRKFDFSTGRPEPTAVLALPGFDLHSARPIRDRGSNIIHGVRVVTDSSAVAWFNPTMQAIQQKADAVLPGRVNRLYANSYAAPRTVLIQSYSDRTPGDFLLYRVDQDRFERIAAARPEIRPEQMGSTELHRIAARDGADLPVWVTRTDGGGARPAVVLVHGGPWERGATWGWDPEVQFLATRGYVVIQPEFRGSTGYGDKHYRAGWKQWGQAMQDDLVDALRFAVDKGWVDPKRVCVAGGSYGGYATLMELARRSSMYRCGIAWAAVTDPRFMYDVYWSDISDDTKEYLYPRLIGDIKADAEMLKANSPIELAANIKAPLMLVYGNYDWRVPISHGKRLREKLQEAGVEPEWVVYDREGHGWAHKKNQVDFWKRIEQFLAKHLQ